MSLTSYTSYADIRAVLGVSDEEIEDATLALTNYLTNLELDLEDIDSDLQSLYTTIAAKQVVDRTVAEQKLFKLVQLYSSYVVSADLLKSLAMFSYERVTDGKAEVQRKAEFTVLESGVLSTLLSLRTRIRVLLPQLDPGYTAPTVVARTFLSSIGLANDPVTRTT